MASNLRASFKERQRKHLSEALPTLPLPAKKTRLKVSREELVVEAPAAQVPPSDVVRPGQELIASPLMSSFLSPAVILLSCPTTLALLAWSTPLVFLRSLHFGVLIRCKSTLSRRRRKCSLLKQLEVAESMQAFLTLQINNSEELRAQLVRVERELAVVWKAAKVEVRQMGEEKEAVEAKCKDVEQERDQLKKELEELRVASEA
ncbi:hypothetical protein PVL29_017794 [Vitis rotundifolia]|uniref:Uncharacterized protein n=1 Tax=Vitis rotundifolia TaxID=103349 RepID=A0AA38ZBC2_VITRO|nr:hypothetical protein PVL29_017794 [Vitis rotundifolia]